MIVNAPQQWIRVNNPLGEEQPRRAGVSSFGLGGVNAHIVLEEYIDKHGNYGDSNFYLKLNSYLKKVPFIQKLTANKVSNNIKPIPQLLLFSTKNKIILKQNVEKFLHYFSVDFHFVLEDIAYTLQIGRQTMDERLAVLASDTEELENRSD